MTRVWRRGLPGSWGATGTIRYSALMLSPIRLPACMPRRWRSPAWLDGGGQLLDIALHDVAAFCAGGDCAPDSCAAAAADVALPLARVASARAAEPGVDTSRVLREFT